MSDQVTKRQAQAKVLRGFRKVHRVTGALLFVFFFIVAVTGLLLGWKKNSNGLLLAKSYKGSSTLSKDWLSVDSLSKQAVYYLKQSDSSLSTHID